MTYLTSLKLEIESKPSDKSVIQKFSPLLPNLDLKYSNVLTIPIPPNVIVPLEFLSESVPYSISILSVQCSIPFDLALSKTDNIYNFTGVYQTLSLQRFLDYKTGTLHEESTADIALKLSPEYILTDSIIATVFVGRALAS